MMKEEKPLLVTSEVALVDPSDSKATKVQWRFTEEGQRIRVSLRSGRIIPLSKIAEDETEDMVMKSAYTEQDWDTKADDLKKVTFKPALSTFEDDIKQLMGVKDPRKRAPTFWY
ncbi:hypothetical protein C0Q70_20751 [Pomacea canaliculata]|uniref:Large ribosomal subunit protein uL24 C-terminal domain-containing protein n=2 Tax=Pomacea canaliculata TaxID=400727 RepID=A0A2T7NGE9_POMCA|nr:hypothetical protein C0Q70_20751 [Pomacea canaliculata]